AATWMLFYLGEQALWMGRTAEAQSFFHQSLTDFRTLGDQWGSCLPISTLGDMAQQQNRHQEALYYFREQLALAKELGDIGGMAVAITHIGVVLEALGEPGTLNQQLADALQLSLEVRIEWVTWVTLLWAAEHFAVAQA